MVESIWWGSKMIIELIIWMIPLLVVGFFMLMIGIQIGKLIEKKKWVKEIEKIDKVISIDNGKLQRRKEELEKQIEIRKRQIEKLTGKT